MMEAVLTLTNPARALMIVTGAFLAALGFAAYRLLDRPQPPTPDEPARNDGSLLDPATPDPMVENRTITEPIYDLDRIAASLNVEVTPDGSVLVHGVPTDLPEDVGLHVAHVAADAATARLEKVLLHRAAPNRDDRRLLTKVAREAVRRQPAVSLVS
jgi:hypothetical protein